ncbi:hypothetical protein ECEC4448_5924, partial [Escherichia coli EC4448]
MSPPSPL